MIVASLFLLGGTGSSLLTFFPRRKKAVRPAQLSIMMNRLPASAFLKAGSLAASRRAANSSLVQATSVSKKIVTSNVDVRLDLSFLF